VFKEADFWLLAGSILCMAIAGSGVLSQLSPLVQAEGISPQLAAYGVTAYAVGQLGGRLAAGWFLDHANPRHVAFLFTFVPAIGFLMLALLQLPLFAAVFAIGMIGVQQGAEIDLFAYFVARRFGVERYGSIYGWIVATSWIGNASGILLFGWVYVAQGSYVLAELIGAVLLAVAAILIALVRIDGAATVPSHMSPEPPQAP
jgi:MFS family permease